MASRRKGLLYFGVDIQAQLAEWWFAEKLPELRQRFGADKDLYFAQLDPATAELYDTVEPLEETLYELVSRQGEIEPGTDDYELFYGPTGLRANVVGKMRFVLRTKLNSAVAEFRPDLLESGDFPFEGAGAHLGYWGGVSGLKKEDDWTVFCEIVEKVRELRATAALVAVAACKNRKPDAGPEVKYLGKYENPYYRGEEAPDA
jgi:hypothetical protein